MEGKQKQDVRCSSLVVRRWALEACYLGFSRRMVSIQYINYTSEYSLGHIRNSMGSRPNRLCGLVHESVHIYLGTCIFLLGVILQARPEAERGLGAPTN